MSDTQHADTPSRAGQVRRRVLALAGVTAAAGTVMVLSSLGSSATAAPAAVAPAAKYFVCKYVGKPGVNERLQTGNNPIDVSGNAIGENPVVVGSFFNDAQGRSFVLAQDTGQRKPPRSACPAPEGPPPSSTPATTPVTTPETTPVTTPETTPVTTPETNPVTTPETTPVTTPETTSAAASVSASSSEVVVPPTSAGPIPGGVSAGLHSPIRYAGVKAWGTILMLLGGAIGLVAGVWPTRRRAH